LALGDLSVVEQRYRAVLAVERGELKIVVAVQFVISRQSLHTWLTRYARDGLAGLMDRSHRPPPFSHRRRFRDDDLCGGLAHSGDGGQVLKLAGKGRISSSIRADNSRIAAESWSMRSRCNRHKKLGAPQNPRSMPPPTEWAAFSP